MEEIGRLKTLGELLGESQGISGSQEVTLVVFAPRGEFTLHDSSKILIPIIRKKNLKESIMITLLLDL